MRSTESLPERLFSRHRWLVHTIYWASILLLYVIFFGRKNSNYQQTLFLVGLLLPVIMLTTYFLNYFLVPRYLLRERYLLFLLYFLYTLVGTIFLELVIVLITFIFMAEVRIKNMSPASIDSAFLITSTLMVVFLGMGVKLLLHYRSSRENYEKLQKEKVLAELNFLKAQLNPHFLFNTLNNLYYLTREKSDRAPGAVLQLSEILDYVLNSSKRDLVQLNEEWRQVENYIALESLRYEDRLSVSAENKVTDDNARIAPMILLSLVENAFKHGAMKLSGKSWITILVSTTEDQILKMVVSNATKSTSSGHGIGLKNLREQLEMIYSQRYSLQISDDAPGQYTVTLTIPV
jgi:sensor histidine kinase YesM